MRPNDAKATVQAIISESEKRPSTSPEISGFFHLANAPIPNRVTYIVIPNDITPIQ
jgi:hypothetical protein